MIIGIIIALAILIGYIKGVIAMPFVLLFMAGHILLLVACLIFCAKCKSKNNFSADEQRLLDEAHNKDEKNRQYNIREKERAQKQHAKDAQEVMDDCTRQLSALRTDLMQVEERITALDVLAADDCDIDTVDGLLKLLNGKRANSLSEALNRYDDLCREEKRDRERRAAEQRRETMEFLHRMEMKTMQKAANDRMQFELEMDAIDARRHREKMEGEMAEIRKQVRGY